MEVRPEEVVTEGIIQYQFNYTTIWASFLIEPVWFFISDVVESLADNQDSWSRWSVMFRLRIPPSTQDPCRTMPCCMSRCPINQGQVLTTLVYWIWVLDQDSSAGKHSEPSLFEDANCNQNKHKIDSWSCIIRSREAHLDFIQYWL